MKKQFALCYIPSTFLFTDSFKPRKTVKSVVCSPGAKFSKKLEAYRKLTAFSGVHNFS
jgi:hypothetical protein